MCTLLCQEVRILHVVQGGVLMKFLVPSEISALFTLKDVWRIEDFLGSMNSGQVVYICQSRSIEKRKIMNKNASIKFPWGRNSKNLWISQQNHKKSGFQTIQNPEKVRPKNSVVLKEFLDELCRHSCRVAG